jgi:hypothetical protein
MYGTSDQDYIMGGEGTSDNHGSGRRDDDSGSSISSIRGGAVIEDNQQQELNGARLDGARLDSQRIDISFVPNHKTLTSAGHAHFSRVADAMAEFIDNSIQASQGIVGQDDTRDITLGLDLNRFSDGDGDDAKSYISILDNGEGMNIETLQKLPVYGLDMESRGLTPSNENASNISKFGVGAKQAGFYLGTQIHVLTSVKGSSEVLELILDKHWIEENFRTNGNNEDAYRGHITVYDLQSMAGSKSSSAQSPSPFTTEGKYNSRLQHVVDDLFAKKLQPSSSSSFTLITIQLREETRLKLLRENSFMSLPTQLAEIYHFHLHPNNLPDPVAARTNQM